MNTFRLVLILLMFYSTAAAQDKRFRFTIAAGTGFTTGLNNLTKPGFATGLYGEKAMDTGPEKTFWLAFDYLMQQPIAARTEPDAPGSNVLKTTTYHKLSVYSLTFGARKYLDNGILFGGGVGVGMFSQIMPTNIYSDGSRYYERYEHGIGDGGLSHQIQLGYQLKKFQVLATAGSIWIPFRFTVDTDYERLTPLYLPRFSLKTGYVF